MLKENKFLIGLGTITAVVSGGLIFAGLKSSSSLEELQTEISSKQASLNKMQRLNPYPTPANAKAKSESLAEVVQKAEEAREKFLAFKPKDMADIPVSEFTESLKASVARVRALFPEENALPKEFTLGFKSYADYLPPEEATGELAYQLGAMEYLFTQLAESGANDVQNVFRANLPMEDGKDWSGAPLKGSATSGKRPAKPRRQRGSAKRGEVLPDIAHRMPCELTFKAPEEVVREFLTRIGNSDQYFFQTRIGRVVNSAPIPSSGNATTDAKASAGAATSDIVVEDEGGIVIEGEAPAAAEEEVVAVKPAESVKILEKISGNEDLNVFLRLDLLVFTEDQKFPKIK